MPWNGWSPCAGTSGRLPRNAQLVPGFNEEAVICKTITSVLATTFSGRLEVIVVDDGSTDRTSEVVTEAFGDDPRVRLFRRPNGGKSAALNFAIQQTECEIFLAIDADTLLVRDAIGLLVRHFEDPALGAAAGNAMVGNTGNLMTKLQSLEYITSQNLDRRASEIVGAISVVPGAIGAWRRLAVIEAGGYGTDTLAEDADLTIGIQRLGWRVIYEPGAIALTEAPDTIRAFLKQRFRWMFGTLQVACKALLSPGGLAPGITYIAIPNIFIFGFLVTLIAPVIDVLLVVTLAGTAFDSIASDTLVGGEALWPIAAAWIVFQLLDIIVAMLGLRLDGGRGHYRLLPWVITQRITYRPLLYWVAIRALLAAIHGGVVGWGKLLRRGSVSLPATR